MSPNAPEQIDDSAGEKDASDHITRPLFEVSKGHTGTENVEQRLDPDRLHEAHIVLQVLLADDVREEEKRKENVVAFNYEAIQAGKTAC